MEGIEIIRKALAEKNWDIYYHTWEDFCERYGGGGYMIQIWHVYDEDYQNHTYFDYLESLDSLNEKLDDEVRGKFRDGESVYFQGCSLFCQTVEGALYAIGLMDDRLTVGK